MGTLFEDLSAQFHQSFIEADRWQRYLDGIKISFLVTLGALCIGIILGILVAIIRTLHDQQKGSEEVAENTEANAPEAQEEDKKVHFVLFKPETFDKDITTMADRFIEKDTLILNMEQTNKDVAKRIIDFLGGVAYAHSGKISRVAEDTYIVMPSHIDITGDDLMDEVESDNVYF